MKTIQVNATKVIIDNKLYLEITGPLINKSMLYHTANPNFTVDCYEEKELRTISQNDMYFGAIVRGGMKILKEITGEIWADADVHRFHMQEIMGVKPALVKKGDFEFTSFDVSEGHLKAAFKKLDWDASLVEGLKPKSSKFDKQMFSALMELCIQYYAEHHQYYFYENGSKHEFRKELFGSID